MLVAVALAIAACSSGPKVPPGILDVTGTWEGVWDGGAIGVGRVSMVLEQTVTTVTGELSISGIQAISATDGPIEGRVQGQFFSFKQPTGVVEAEMMVNGEEMSGISSGPLKIAMRLQRLPPPAK